jgi:hypothetical protein
MFCPGGWREAKNYAAEDLKGLRHSCKKAQVVPENSTTITTLTIQADGLTTKSNRSTRPQDCVPMPGFYLNATSRATQEAALCPRSTYSPGYGRIRQCLRCQSGTEEKNPSPYTSSLPAATNQLRINRLEVCREYPATTAAATGAAALQLLLKTNSSSCVMPVLTAKYFVSSTNTQVQ